MSGMWGRGFARRAHPSGFTVGCIESPCPESRLRSGCPTIYAAIEEWNEYVARRIVNCLMHDYAKWKPRDCDTCKHLGFHRLCTRPPRPLGDSCLTDEIFTQREPKPAPKPKLEPLPCPRCGSGAHRWTERHYGSPMIGGVTHTDRFAVSCNETTCPLSNINLFYYATLDEAVKKWNKYVMDEHLKREQEKIHKMLEYVHFVSRAVH